MDRQTDTDGRRYGMTSFVRRAAYTKYVISAHSQQALDKDIISERLLAPAEIPTVTAAPCNQWQKAKASRSRH